MIRKALNEKNLKTALLVSLVITQVLAFTTNSFTFYPHLTMSSLIQGLFIYTPFLVIYVFCIRVVGLTLYRSVTQSSNLSLSNLVQGLAKPKLLFVPLFFIAQPYYTTVVLKAIDFLTDKLHVDIGKRATGIFTSALTATTQLSWQLMLLSVTTIVGYIGFNLYTRQIAKFAFIRKQIIRPIDDLISWAPMFSFVYFLYLLAS